jgi:lipoprotein-releasing system permease protein
MAPRSGFLTLWLAWRYLIAKKGKSLSFMTMVSILGVAIGVAALVTVLSVMGGFEYELRNKMFRGLPHLEIFNKQALAGFSLKQHSIKDIKELYPEAEGIEPFIKADIVIKHRKSIASATLFGIEPELGGKLWGFFSTKFDGHLKDLEAKVYKNEFSVESLDGLILGDSLAIQLGVGYGDEVFVLSPYASVGDVLSGSQISGHFKIVGIFQTDSPEIDSRYAVVSLKSARKFLPDYDTSLENEDYVSGIALNFKHPELIDKTKDRLTRFPDLATVTWKDVNKSLLFALKLEKFTMSSILLLIVLVAAFSISGTIMMTVFHRRSQIALFRSLGMSKAGVWKIFLTIGVFIGTLGTLLGLSIGLGICGLLHYFQFVDLPIGMFYQNKLPVRFLPTEYMVIAICSWLLSILATLYPSLVAAKQDPGTGLRYS